MSYNNIFSDNSHLSHRILKDPVKVNLGDKLNKVRDRKHTQKEIAIYDVNDKPTFAPISDFGSVLLDTLSLADLKASILETSEEAIRLTADSNNEINFFTGGTTASNLRMQITDPSVKITNSNLLVDTIKKSDDTSAISIEAGNISLQKPNTTFRSTTDKGYVRIQNSADENSGYIDFLNGSTSARGAYLGLANINDGNTRINNSLKLGLENNCGFEITDAATSIFKVSLENDTINMNYPTTVNTTLTANTSITTPAVIAQVFRSKQGDSEILLQNNGATHSIRIIPGATNFIQSTSNSLSFTKLNNSTEQIKIDHNSSAPHNTGTLISKYNISIQPPTGNLNFNLFKCPTDEQVSLYSHTNTDYGFVIQKSANDDGIKINMFHNGTFKPMYYNSGNTSQMVIGSEAIQTDTQRFIVVSSSRFKNGLTSDADINVEGTSKLHFSSNNYFYNDANHHLNLFLNNNKNFVANTGNDVSTYDYKINSVSKLKIEDTQTTISNKLICPVINTTNIKVTGDTDAIELKADEIRLKKPLYVEYANRKITLQAGATDNVIYNKSSGLNLGFNIAYNPTGEVETITTTSQNTSKVLINNTGVSLAVSNSVNTLPSNVLVASSSAITCSKDVNIVGTSVKLNFNSNNYFQNDGNNHLNLFINNSKNFVANTGNDVSTYDFKIYSVSKLKIEDAQATISNKLICPTLNTTNIQLTGETSNAITLATDLITLNKSVSVPNLLKTNNVLPTFNNSYDLGSTTLRYNDVYSTNLNFSTCDATGQCNIATILCSTDLITGAACNIKMNNTTETKSIIPLVHDTYNIGEINNYYNNIYCDVLICQSGTVGGSAITSDRRLKTDIVDLEPKFGLDFVNRMRPVSYTYKGKTRTHFGLIADDLYDLLQSDKYSIWSKLKDDQGTQTIQTQEFIGVFIKAIQELYGIITTTDNKPIIIKEQVKSENHKCNCNSVELISQLNSYEIELLEKGEQLKVLDNQLEEMVEDNLSLKKNSNIIIERLNKLELKNKELENKLNEKTNEIIDEDTDGGINMIESLQLRNHENELKISKLENKLKRLSTIINKIVKNN